MAGRSCEHLEQAMDVPAHSDGCEECLVSGGKWVHLRRCVSCGHVGCCDSSPNRHARAHFEGTGHVVIQTAEPGETWRHCYVDNMYI